VTPAKGEGHRGKEEVYRLGWFWKLADRRGVVQPQDPVPSSGRDVPSVWGPLAKDPARGEVEYHIPPGGEDGDVTGGCEVRPEC